jgi:hypothetical protein
MECDGRTAEDSKRSLPPVLPTMAGLMEQVCVCARVLLWRWLGKCCHMSNHYSVIPHFWELFDCPSYNIPGFSSVCPYSVNVHTFNLEIKFDTFLMFFISVCEDTLHDF